MLWKMEKIFIIISVLWNRVVIVLRLYCYLLNWMKIYRKISSRVKVVVQNVFDLMLFVIVGLILFEFFMCVLFLFGVLNCFRLILLLVMLLMLLYSVIIIFLLVLLLVDFIRQLVMMLQVFFVFIDFIMGLLFLKVFVSVECSVEVFILVFLIVIL